MKHNHPIAGDHEDPLPGPTWTVMISGIFLLAVVLLGTTALTYDVLRVEREVKVLSQAPAEIEMLRAQQRKRLQGPPRKEIRLENGGDVSVVIPIDLAMQLELRDGEAER